jgi:hypothetical protein
MLVYTEAGTIILACLSVVTKEKKVLWHFNLPGKNPYIFYVCVNPAEIKDVDVKINIPLLVAHIACWDHCYETFLQSNYFSAKIS